MQYGLVAVNHQCMTCVMPSLEAHHGVHVPAQKVNYFAFTFVTPLGAQHNYAFCHFSDNLR